MSSPRTVLRPALAAALVAAGLTLVSGTTASADPAAPASASDAQKQLADFGHQAEVLSEQMHNAKIKLDGANAAKTKATTALATARKSLASANAQEARYRGTVDQLAQASYQGARLDRLSALMTSTSPQDLLDQMSGLEMLASDTSARLAVYSSAQVKAAASSTDAQRASAASKAAAELAATTTAQLSKQQDELVVKTTKAKAAYATLSVAERASYAGATVPAGYTAPTAPSSRPAAPSSRPAAPSSRPAAPSSQPAAPSSQPAAVGAAAAAPAVAAGSGSEFGALQAALTKLGSPYSWGATGPNAFDCSGLTSWAYAQVGIHIPRSAQAQASSGTPVSMANLQPGDLVFFYSPVSHVGIYAGDGMMVHAPTFGQSVKVTPIKYMPFVGARRY